MNWKNEAIEKLRRYDTMRQAARNIPEEIKRLKQEALLLRNSAPQDVFVLGNGTDPEEARINNIVQRQELERNLENVRQWLQVTDRGLLSLSPDERLILQHFYLYPKPSAMNTVCSELQLEQSSVYRKRDQALLRFTAALYGFTES